MSHIRGHFHRFDHVFVRHVPHSGTPPTPFPFTPGPGQQAGARSAFNRAPRSARSVAAGQRILRRRCPVKIFSFFSSPPHPPLLPVLVETLPTRLPHSTQIFHEMSHIRGHLQRFTCVFARDVPHSGTSPTVCGCFCTRCPTSGDISNGLRVFLHEMSHIRGHLQRFACVFARDVPHPWTSPTVYPCFLHEMSHIRGHLQRFARVFAQS